MTYRVEIESRLNGKWYVDQTDVTCHETQEAAIEHATAMVEGSNDVRAVVLQIVVRVNSNNIM